MNVNPKTGTYFYALIIAVFLLCGFAIYANTLHAPFIYDDIRNITENPHIRLTKITPEQILELLEHPSTRPVANFSFALNHYFGGYDPFGYHLVNILIHLVNGILLFLLIRLTPGMTRPGNGIFAFFAALVWLVHPLHTQSVTFIAQRMNALAAMFYLMSLICYIKGRMAQRSNAANTGNQAIHRAGRLWFSGAVISGILALGSKQNAAVLPVFIFLYEWFFFQDLNWAWFKKKLPLIGGVILVIAVIGAIWIRTNSELLNLSSIQVATIPQRLLTEARVLVYYISLILLPFPSRLSLVYDYPISSSLMAPFTTLMCLLGIMGVFALCILTIKKNRVLAFCILWFFGNLAIESTLVALAPIFEHRTYLPSMMVVSLFVIVLLKYLKTPRLSAGLLSLLLIVLSLWTIERNRIWRDDVIFWRDCISKSPNKANPYNNLGYSLAHQKKIDQAIGYFESAIRIAPYYGEAHYNLGLAYEEAGRYSEAVLQYRRALAIGYDRSNTHASLGRALYKAGELEAAVGHLEKAIALNPESAIALNDMGLVLKAQNQPDQAMEYFQKALALEPDNIELLNNMGNILAKQGKFKEAVNRYAAALKIDPKHAVTLNNLGNAYLATGAYDEAIAQYQAALDQNPGLTKALHNLAFAYAAKKDYEKSAETFKRILETDPENPAVLYNIACMYARQNKTDEAVKWLQQALDKGYDNWERMEKDGDLEGIRDSEYYREVIKKMNVQHRTERKR